MKVVVIDAFPLSFAQSLMQTGNELVFRPDCTPEEARLLIRDAEILVINSKIRLDREVLSTAPDLRLVCRAGVGLDHFDLAEMERRKIEVFSTPGANAVTVAEQTIGMLVSLMHHVSRASAQVKKGLWLREENRAWELKGRTIGIIGYGNIGSRVASRLENWGMRVLAYDKYKSGFGNAHVQECGMDEIFREADILSLHLPLTDETRGMGNADFFSRFAKPVWFLNLARGEIVSTHDLVVSLRSGRIIGAALDVLENEKLHTLTPEQRADFEELCACDNVIITPHIGGWSFESLERINGAILGKIIAFASANR